MTPNAPTAALVLPRRLAIRLLHEAQKATPEPIHGFVGARDGSPVSYAPAVTALEAHGDVPWAEVFSNPLAPAVPDAAQLRGDQLTLMISLDIKGVLQIRAWRAGRDGPNEQGLSITD